MKPESIVVSLEMAKKLRKAGFPQANHQFYWIHNEHTETCVHHTEEDSGGRIASRLVVDDPEILYAAPTASELIRKIPVERRSDVPLERLDDPNEWAAIYCALQANHLR